MFVLLTIRSSIALGLVLGLDTAAWAGPPDTRLLEEFVREFDEAGLPWSDVPTIETLLLDGWSGEPDLATARSVLGDKLGIPGSLTDSVLEAVLLSTKLSDEWPEDLNEKQRAEVKRALEALEEASRQATNPMPVARSLLWLHDEWGQAVTEDDTALLEWLSGSFDPAGIALEIHRGDWLRLNWTAGKESLVIGLGSRAGHPSLLHALARSVEDPSWRTALAGLAYQALDAMGPEVPNEARVLLAQNWIETLLDVGLTATALTTLDSLPTPIRGAVLSENEGDVAVSLEGLPLTGNFEDVRLDLAAALALEDDSDRAAQLLQSVVSASESDSTDDEPSGAELQIAILERYLRPTDSDPFDFFVDVVDEGESYNDDNPLGPVTWRRLFASLAHREHYPSLERFQLRRALDRLEWPADSEELPRASVGTDLASAVDRAAAAVGTFIDSLEGSLAGVVPANAASPATAVDATVRRVIGAPPVARFDERPLPVGVNPAELTDKQRKQRFRKQTVGLTLAQTHEIVRVERTGNDVVAIGVSQDYDPVGELSRGAYWVLRSRDGGISWERPLYTGLRVTLPYVVRSVSDLPLVRDEGLQIEVEIRELDTSFISFPPVGTRTKREETGLFLDIPWNVLERDSDEDGLTDLAEERLITDPRNADTDGDGLDDSRDPLPQVPLELAADDQTLVLEALLREIGGAETRAIVHEVAGSGSPTLDLDEFLTNAKRVSLASEYSTFIIGERGAFRSIHSDRRIVVLTPEEHAAASERFGPIFATRIPLVMINRSGDRAVAIWDASWTGGQLSFEKTDGKWVAQTTSFWIT